MLKRKIALLILATIGLVWGCGCPCGIPDIGCPGIGLPCGLNLGGLLGKGIVDCWTWDLVQDWLQEDLFG